MRRKELASLKTHHELLVLLDLLLNEGRLLGQVRTLCCLVAGQGAKVVVHPRVPGHFIQGVLLLVLPSLALHLRAVNGGLLRHLLGSRAAWQFLEKTASFLLWVEDFCVDAKRIILLLNVVFVLSLEPLVGLNAVLPQSFFASFDRVVPGTV